MVYHVLIILLIVILNGCTTSVKKNDPRTLTKKKTLMDVYINSVQDGNNDAGQFMENKLKEQQVFGYVKPYVPVLEQPVVRKIWIPDQSSEDDAQVLVSGHWTYVMVQGPKWYVDNTSQTNSSSIIPGEPIQQVKVK